MNEIVDEIERMPFSKDSCGKPVILCVDDNKDFLQVLMYLIEALGYDLATVSNAEDGLELARARKPDLIFCDLGLPGMDGFEFAKKIRTDATLYKTPMIAISGRTDCETAIKALTSGFNKIFPKPVKFADIRAALFEVLPQ